MAIRSEFCTIKFMSESPNPDHFQPQTQEVQHSQVSALVPEKVARGVFSTGAVVLNGAHEFVIDFLLRMTRPHQVAARIVLPPPVVPRLIAALRENIENYKKRFGELPTAPLPIEQKPSATTEQAHTGDATGAVAPIGDAPADGEAPSGALAAQNSSSGASSGSAAPGEIPPTSEIIAQPGSALTEPGNPVGGDQMSAQDLYDQLKLSDDQMSGCYANAVMIGHTATEFSFDFITTFFPRSVVSSRVFLAAPNVKRFLDSLSHSFQQFQQKVAQAQKSAQKQRPPEPPAET